MHGVLAARAPVVGFLLVVLVAAPASADPLPECANVFVQPQEQSGTEVTPVATGSQFGLVVMVEGAEGVGAFASAQVTPLDCPNDVIPHPPQGGVEPPEPAEPVTPEVPRDVALPAEAVAALDAVSNLLLP